MVWSELYLWLAGMYNVYCQYALNVCLWTLVPPTLTPSIARRPVAHEPRSPRLLCRIDEFQLVVKGWYAMGVMANFFLLYATCGLWAVDKLGETIFVGPKQHADDAVRVLLPILLGGVVVYVLASLYVLRSYTCGQFCCDEKASAVVFVSQGLFPDQMPDTPLPYLRQAQLSADTLPNLIVFGLLVQPIAIYVLKHHFEKGMPEPPFLRERRLQLCQELDALAAREGAP